MRFHMTDKRHNMHVNSTATDGGAFDFKYETLLEPVLYKGLSLICGTRKNDSRDAADSHPIPF